MKNVFLSLAVIAALVVAGVGGTFAHFSDVETVTGNQLVAGTLDLKMSTDGGATWIDDDQMSPFEVTVMNPCVWYKEDYKVKNWGNKDGSLKFHLTVTETSNNVDTEPEIEAASLLGIPNPSDIDKYVDVIVVFCHYENILHLVEGAETWQEAKQMLIDAGVPASVIHVADKLNNVHCQEFTLDSTFRAKEEVLFQLLVHLEQGTAGTLDDVNLYQGDWCKFTYEFTLIELAIQ